MTARLEDLRPGTSVGGVVPGREVTAVALGWHGTTAVTLTYRDPDCHVGERLLYRSDEPNLSVGERQARWSFDADGETFTLASEARRIRLAHLVRPHARRSPLPSPALASGRRQCRSRPGLTFQMTS
jgi:hypothetical protein